MGPRKHPAFTIERRDSLTGIALRGMDGVSGVVGEAGELGGMDEVFLFLAAGDGAGEAADFAGDGFLPDAFLSDEVGAEGGSFHVGGTENEAAAHVEGEDFALLFADGGVGGDFGLHAGDDAGSGGADSVDGFVVADAVLGGGDEVLEFVGDEKEEVFVVSLAGADVEAAEDVEVEEDFEVGLHVAALGGEGLGHGDGEDGASVEVGEVEGVGFVAGKDGGDIGIEEKSEVGLEGAFDCFALFVSFGFGEGGFEEINEALEFGSDGVVFEGAVFLWQWLALLDELDEVALLDFGEFVVFCGWTGHNGKRWWQAKWNQLRFVVI